MESAEVLVSHGISFRRVSRVLAVVESLGLALDFVLRSF